MNLTRLAITVLLVLAKEAHTGKPTQKDLLLAQEILDFHKKSNWWYIENTKKYECYFDDANLLIRPEDVSSLQDSLKGLNVRLQKKRKDEAEIICFKSRKLGIKVRSFAISERRQPLKEVFFSADEKKTIRDKESLLIMFVDEQMELLPPNIAIEMPKNNIQDLLSYHEKTIQYLHHPIIKYITQTSSFAPKSQTKKEWNTLFEEFNASRPKNGGYAYYGENGDDYAAEFGPIVWNPEEESQMTNS